MYYGLKNKCNRKVESIFSDMKVYIQHIKKLLDAYEGVIRKKSIALDAYLRKKGLKSMTPVSTLKKWNRANETRNMQKKGNTKDQSNNQ